MPPGKPVDGTKNTLLPPAAAAEGEHRAGGDAPILVARSLNVCSEEANAMMELAKADYLASRYDAAGIGDPISREVFRNAFDRFFRPNMWIPEPGGDGILVPRSFFDHAFHRAMEALGYGTNQSVLHIGAGEQLTYGAKYFLDQYAPEDLRGDPAFREEYLRAVEREPMIVTEGRVEGGERLLRDALLRSVESYRAARGVPSAPTYGGIEVHVHIAPPSDGSDAPAAELPLEIPFADRPTPVAPAMPQNAPISVPDDAAAVERVLDVYDRIADRPLPAGGTVRDLPPAARARLATAIAFGRDIPWDIPELAGLGYREANGRVMGMEGGREAVVIMAPVKGWGRIDVSPKPVCQDASGLRENLDNLTFLLMQEKRLSESSARAHAAFIIMELGTLPDPKSFVEKLTGKVGGVIDANTIGYFGDFSQPPPVEFVAPNRVDVPSGDMRFREGRVAAMIATAGERPAEGFVKAEARDVAVGGHAARLRERAAELSTRPGSERKGSDRDRDRERVEVPRMNTRVRVIP